MKKIVLVLVPVIVIAGGIVWWKQGRVGPKPPEPAPESESTPATVGNNICAEFSVDFVYSAIKKPIVRVEGPDSPSIDACKYYTEYSDTWFENKLPGGRFVTIVLENLEVAVQKQYIESSGGSSGTDSRINMDHLILYREDGTIWNVDLIINPNRYLRVDKFAKAITDEEEIEFAARVADKIQGRSNLKIETNPIDLQAEKEKTLGDSQKVMARNFFDLLAQQKFQEAINLMEANEETKQMWLTNFQTLKSVSVKKIEEVYKDEWTPSRQVFKATLEVEATSQGEQYGWNKGENFRWISLQKNNNIWQVHELANNP